MPRGQVTPRYGGTVPADSIMAVVYAAACPFVFLVGQVEMPDPKSAGAVGWLLLTLAALAVAINQGQGVVLNFRRLQRKDVEDRADLVSRGEHVALKDEVSHLRGEVSGLTKSLSTELSDINRVLGRIEGALGLTPNKPGR